MTVIVNYYKYEPTIGRASLVFILRDVTRFALFSPNSAPTGICLVFDPMLSLWGEKVCYK